jgi:peptidyl-prolyl cis-trans isomerase SurA
VAEGKVITVDDIRREIAPLIPQLQREARNEQEFNQRLEAMQDDIIQQLVDRVLIVKEFYKDEKRRIPQSFVDNAVAESLITQFEGDRSKFLAYLRSRGLTRLEYRKEVEEDIIYSYMRGQQRKSTNVVSPVQVETFYNENKERFYQEDSVRMRMIQFSGKNGETEEQLRQKARQVRPGFRLARSSRISRATSPKTPGAPAVATGAGRSGPTSSRSSASRSSRSSRVN